jgi:hypothetical protein
MRAAQRDGAPERRRAVVVDQGLCAGARDPERRHASAARDPGEHGSPAVRGGGVRIGQHGAGDEVREHRHVGAALGGSVERERSGETVARAHGAAIARRMGLARQRAADDRLDPACIERWKLCPVVRCADHAVER